MRTLTSHTKKFKIGCNALRKKSLFLYQTNQSSKFFEWIYVVIHAVSLYVHVGARS